MIGIVVRKKSQAPRVTNLETVTLVAMLMEVLEKGPMDLFGAQRMLSSYARTQLKLDEVQQLEPETEFGRRAQKALVPLLKANLLLHEVAQRTEAASSVVVAEAAPEESAPV